MADELDPVNDPMWSSYWEMAQRLRTHIGDIGEALLMVKLAAQTGQAADAVCGMLGVRPHTEVFATPSEALAELADLVVTAGAVMVAIAGGDVGEAEAHLRQQLAYIANITSPGSGAT